MALDTIIEFKKASIFQGDNLILADVNLRVEKGEFIYLIGKVGSGKSSLIKTINAELPLREGEGQVAGYDLQKIRSGQVPFLRRKIGIVFQDFQLLTDRTVFDNLLFVLNATGWKSKKEMKERIDNVLDKVGLKHKEYKMPHQLSGGEQQRVVIARALLNNPEIILADEPTGNLDPDTSDEIMKLLFDIAATGRAVIMATHNYSLLKKFPAKTIKCEKSRLFETEHISEIDFDSLMEE
ncbi:MAG TPA: ATP-binding cassette domain-containing protein [Perlabentimonas sp.]|jgi:cell division transport system ATP-binding protein|nr:ATP-binding cassette domain-containing protein [Bacteroidales bacterium]MDD4673713.1 ATP-binding cassette domain-containing protein [Bacteroidales bacterium]MDY0349002.1 ATP-binding cassette domain-containing protein [Tenuifilaceae bacterium]HZJ73569.1 ATP-binding cassette domain-containing protein [Perlabentimonas sp.]